MEKCRCKNPTNVTTIQGVGVKCNKCFKWVFKIRKTFHKPTKVAGKKKGYNRKEEKKKARKQIKETY